MQIGYPETSDGEHHKMQAKQLFIKFPTHNYTEAPGAPDRQGNGLVT